MFEPRLKALIKQKIERCVQKLLEHLKTFNLTPKRVFLFGSIVPYLNGQSHQFHATSDIDIGLCFEDADDQFEALGLPIWGPKTSYGSIFTHRVEITPFECSYLARTMEGFFKGDILELELS